MKHIMEIIEATKLVEDIFNSVIKPNWEKNLKSKGVKLPTFKEKENFTHKVLVLCYLAKDYPTFKSITKEELTLFVRIFYPDTNDEQEGRHLSTQSGWNISKKRGVYEFIDLENTFPYWKKGRREETNNSFLEKRCMTCGAIEGETHWKYGGITTIQKAHKDPNFPLTENNIIAQCSYCNQIYKDKFIFDDNGNVKNKNERSIYWKS